MKNFEGKTVFMMPTGNANRHWNGEPKIAKVIKVARVNMTIEHEGGYTEVLRMGDHQGNTLHSECNSGYKVFLSRREFESERKRLEMVSKWHKKSCFGWVDKLSIEQLNTLFEMAGIEND